MRRLAVFALVTFLALPAARAQEEDTPSPPPQRSFATPEAAVEALVATVRTAPGGGRLVSILGPNSASALRSGDPVADRSARQAFLAAYEARNAIERPSPGVARLVVGADGWTFPFPLRQDGNRWRFDSRAGAQELLDRRIGRNELDAVQVLRAVVEAQGEYAALMRQASGAPAYARRFTSTPGQRDGLYWETAEGEAESPLGPLAAAASADGYRTAARGRPQPYHGYFFRILEAQGPSAQGGAQDYVADGRMSGGFAVIAWPARYGNSGIMTFMVNHQGVVYQANLGPNTEMLARRIRVFEPGEGWTRVAP